MGNQPDLISATLGRPICTSPRAARSIPTRIAFATLHVVSSSDDDWLTVKDAYPIAVQRGYTSNKNGFRMLTEAGFRKLGFEVDRSRTEKGARDSRWLCSIPGWSPEDAQ